jgi:hypothetical protein
MKAIYCELCGDIVAPYGDHKPRKCACGRHAVWWEDGAKGLIRVADLRGTPEEVRAVGGKPLGDPKVWILGITNALLSYPGRGTPSSDEVQRLIDEHPDSYLFKTTRSLIVRIRPGQSGDSAWSALPAAHYPAGMGEESRRLHREYNRLVREQEAGAKNGAEVRKLTDEAADKGIILVPGGENL